MSNQKEKGRLLLLLNHSCPPGNMQNIHGFWHMKGYCRNPAFQSASRFKQKSRLLRYLHNPLFIPTHAAHSTASTPACLRFGYPPQKLRLSSPASFCGGRKLPDSDLYTEKTRSDILTLMFFFNMISPGVFTLHTRNTLSSSSRQVPAVTGEIAGKLKPKKQVKSGKNRNANRNRNAEGKSVEKQDSGANLSVSPLTSFARGVTASPAKKFACNSKVAPAEMSHALQTEEQGL